MIREGWNFTWTNWTFGIWWDNSRGHEVWGIDIGPLEYINRSRMRKNREKGKR